MENKIEKTLIRILLVLSIGMYLFLFGFSFLFSYVNTVLEDEHLTRVTDSIVVNAIAVVLVISVIYLVNRFTREKLFAIKTERLAFILSVLSSIIALWWVFASGAAPQADQYKICYAASQLNAGDYSSLEKGGYLAECPHQLGIVTFIRFLFFIFGDGNYKAFQVASALSVGLMVLCIYRITVILSKDNHIAEIISLILAVTCFPLYFYSAFVYGEIISTMLIMWGFYFFLKLYEKFNYKRLVAFALLTGGAVFIRQNSIIAVIAMLGVAFVKMLLERNKKTIVILIALILGVLFQTATTKIIYSTHTAEDAEAIPSILYISMGMNDAGRYAGWYDGSNFEIFERNDCDSELAAAEGKEIIRDFISSAKQSPVSCVNFYLRKILQQWSAPMYQSIVMNNNIEGEQSSIVKSLYEPDKTWSFLDGWMNIHQLLIYLSILVFLICSWRKSSNLVDFVIVIAIFGGFLFSILWEAKARYVFPYYLMMMPIAGIGIEKILGILKRNK